MKDWKAIAGKLLYPPVWLTVLLTVVSAGGLLFVFLKGLDTSPVAYGVYVLAFYTLTAVCARCVQVFPRLLGRAKQKVYDTPYGNRYMTDAAFKTHVGLYLSLVFNLLYAGINILSLILYRSAWFGILAGYYIILAVMRFLLVRYFRREGIGTSRRAELRRSRLCAMILMTVNLVLSGAVLMILYQDKGYAYHGILIYVMAMYTFYVTTHAITNIVKYRKYNSPVMSTAMVINLSAALWSMLSLETAMLTQFGADMAASARRVMVAATGGGISVAVVAMSLYMILRATKEIKEQDHARTEK